MTGASIKLELNIPADNPELAGRLMQQFQALAQGEALETGPQQVGSTFRARMDRFEFMAMFESLRTAGNGRTVREAYLLAEAVHERFFRTRMYSDEETFWKILGKNNRKKEKK